MEMFFPSSSCRNLLGLPALVRGLLGVCMNRSTKENTPWSTDMILKRLSSFQAALSSSAMRPAPKTKCSQRIPICTEGCPVRFCHVPCSHRTPSRKSHSAWFCSSLACGTGDAPAALKQTPVRAETDLWWVSGACDAHAARMRRAGGR